MSIFEPIPRESRLDDGTLELDSVPSDTEAAHTGGSWDPRSIGIAGLVVAGIVVAGLVAANAAKPEGQPRPVVAARVDPGAAAVEQAEAERSAPTSDSSDSSSDDSADEVSDDAPTWQEPEDSRDDRPWSGDSKRDDKPGRGHGRGHG